MSCPSCGNSVNLEEMFRTAMQGKSKEEAGPIAWEAMRSTVRAFPCPTCKQTGLVLLSGIQDMVNVGAKNEAPYDRENWKAFYEEVQKVNGKIQEQGKHKLLTCSNGNCEVEHIIR